MISRDRYLHQRQSHLPGKVLLDVRDGQSNRCLHRAPQIRVDSVAVCVRAHVAAHAFSKLVATGVRIEHGDDCRALVVSDLVKGLRRLVGRVDLLQHRVRGGNRVRLFALLEDVGGLQTRFPFRMQVIGGVRLHPTGEALVEPQVVPPGHGHQVAEPLMRHFVSDHEEDQLPVAFGRELRVEQEVVLRIEDRAPILHRAADDLPGRRDQIEFRQRKGDAEIVVVVVEELRGLLECVDCLRRVASLDHDTEIHTVNLSVDTLEVSDAHIEEIRRHLGSLSESYSLQSWRHGRNFRCRHVRERHAVLGSNDRHGERRLAAGLIPTWQENAGLRRFEVRSERPARAVGTGVVHGEESRGGTSDLAVIVDGEDVLTGSDRLAERQRGST